MVPRYSDEIIFTDICGSEEWNNDYAKKIPYPDNNITISDSGS